MKKHRMTLAALLLVGCGGEDAEGLLRDILAQEDQATIADCDCFWAERGYDSSAQCAADNLATTAEQNCVVEVLRPVAAINPQFFRCVRDSFRSSLTCIDSVGCDEAGITACLEMNDVCPDNPCAGLTGDRFDECQLEVARADAALDDCD